MEELRDQIRDLRDTQRSMEARMTALEIKQASTEAQNKPVRMIVYTIIVSFLTAIVAGVFALLTKFQK